MQSEVEYDWMNQETAAQEAYKYFMRTDPEMRDILGPIEKIDDSVTGREMRVRQAKVAMMRNSPNMVDTVVYLDPFPHIRQEKGQDLRGWYNNKSDGNHDGKRERPCMTDAILTQPYGGYCNVGCVFCYINAGGRGYRGSGLTTVPLGYGEQVRKQLAAMQISQAGYFSSFTDPFMPLEGYYHNTQAGATAFVEAGLPVFFLSRLKYPEWAFDLLARNPLSYMQKSINCWDEEDWRKLSPNALSLAEHMEDIREARRRGIYVSIQVNPIIAGVITHEDVEQTFEMLAEAGANHVIVKFVEANFPWAPAMIERIEKKFGNNRGGLFRELFVENSAGQQKTVKEEYRLEGHRRYQKKATSLGLTYATCFEYSKRPDGTHRSVGHDFLTADTCHGHRVPFHFKKGDRFEPLSVCPTSGCLTCADDTGTGKGKCGSELLGQARALKLPDLKRDPMAPAPPMVVKAAPPPEKPPERKPGTFF